MHTLHTWTWKLAVVVGVMFAATGGWGMLQGQWELIPQALADDKRDDRGGRADHFACYEVKCIDYYGHDKECDFKDAKVTIFNQFTDRHRGEKVVVKDLKLLCAPTKKVPERRD